MSSSAMCLVSFVVLYALTARSSAPVHKLISRISGPSAAAGNNFSSRDSLRSLRSREWKVLNFRLTIFRYGG